MELLIIRHGESEADILKVHEGRADFELTGRGHAQAKAMAQFVRDNHDLSAIYCSTLKRAFQTASHLSDATGIPLQPEEMLMEFNNGLLAGLDHATVLEKYPYVDSLPVHASVYEQESMLEFRFRAEYMLSRILSENDADSTVAVVAHGGMINQLYRAFLGLSMDSDIGFATGDTGIHVWRITKDRRVIAAANLTGHTVGI